MEQPEGLKGARILVVEDEFYLADDLAGALREQGAEVVGPVASVPKAEAALEESEVDCAILDMNLRGRMAYPIADRLQADGIPFMVVSGYSSEAIPERFRDARQVEKPFDTSTVLETLSALLHQSKRRAGVSPLPR